MGSLPTGDETAHKATKIHTRGEELKLSLGIALAFSIVR